MDESCATESNTSESVIMDLDVNNGDFIEMMDIEEQEKVTRNFVFVDIQGFKTYRDRFICKEICVISDEDFYHAIIQPPYDFEKLPSHYKRQANWLYNQFHGLAFDSGKIHMIQVIQDVYPMLMSKTVVMKGTEKIKWIKHIFRNCGEIECINFDDLDLKLDENSKNNCPFMCDYHLERTFSNMDFRNDGGKRQPKVIFHCAKVQAIKIEEAVKQSNFMYDY